MLLTLSYVCLSFLSPSLESSGSVGLGRQGREVRI